MSSLLKLFGVLGSGGSGAPVYSLADLLTTYNDQGAPTQTYAVEPTFRTDATVDMMRDIQADSLNEQDPFTDNTAATWIRCTYVSGSNVMTGPTLGTWHVATTQRLWRYAYASTGGFDQISGVYTFALSSDSSGSPIEATRTITFTVGETA